MDSLQIYGPEKTLRVLLAPRKIGLSKDPPLISAHKLPGHKYAAELLQHYPVSKMLRFVELPRKVKEWKLGYGHRKREAVNEALERKEWSWHEYQAIRYPKMYRDLIRVTHIKPPTSELSGLFKYLLGKGEPPTDRPRSVDMVRKGELTGEELFGLS